MYDSIFEQNYTNFKIIHIDDHSVDSTVNNTVNYLSGKPQDLIDKVKLVVQPYQRNALYNRNYAIIEYC